MKSCKSWLLLLVIPIKNYQFNTILCIKVYFKKQ